MCKVNFLDAAMLSHCGMILYRLDERLEVKVSDFVLCHELFERGLQYGTEDDWGKLPIKWMAPETLEGFVFTSASDVVCSLLQNEFCYSQSQ